MKKKMPEGRPANILVVEDDPGDLNMVRRFLEDSKIHNNLYEATDGEQALDFLYRRGEYEESEVPRPDLILLDLNLPKVDGRELLEDINGDDILKKIPVVVLTTSQDESDVWKSYDLGASSYIVKPVDMEQFQDTIETLKQYWLQVVVLPDEGTE